MYSDTMAEDSISASQEQVFRRIERVATRWVLIYIWGSSRVRMKNRKTTNGLRVSLKLFDEERDEAIPSFFIDNEKIDFTASG